MLVLISDNPNSVMSFTEREGFIPKVRYGKLLPNRKSTNVFDINTIKLPSEIEYNVNGT